MSVAVESGTCPDYIRKWEVSDQAKEDPQHTPYEPFLNTTHSVLQVCRPSELIPVMVFDGTNNKGIPFHVKKSDTIEKLKKAYLMKKPGMTGSLNLIYNGEPVVGEKTLGELGVRANAKFITYQKCVGG